MNTIRFRFYGTPEVFKRNIAYILTKFSSSYEKYHEQMTEQLYDWATDMDSLPVYLYDLVKDGEITDKLQKEIYTWSIEKDNLISKIINDTIDNGNEYAFLDSIFSFDMDCFWTENFEKLLTLIEGNAISVEIYLDQSPIPSVWEKK